MKSSAVFRLFVVLTSFAIFLLGLLRDPGGNGRDWLSSIGEGWIGAEVASEQRRGEDAGRRRPNETSIEIAILS